MNVAVFFDPEDLSDIEKAEAELNRYRSAHRVSVISTEIENAIRHMARTTTGQKLLKTAVQHFGPNKKFTLKDLERKTGTPVASLHSLVASLGRAEKHRRVKVFNQHGKGSGGPNKMSLTPEVHAIIVAA